MKNVTLLLLILGISIGSFKAQGDAPQKKENRKARKIAFITSKLELTPVEAEKFWPVYNQAETEKKALKKEHKSAHPKKKISEMSDAEVEKLIDSGLEFQQKELDLRKKYHANFKEVLPIKKVAKLLRLEHEFKKQQQAQKKGERKRTPSSGKATPAPTK